MMGGSGGLGILFFIGLLALIAWAAVRVFPDWRERMEGFGPAGRTGSAEEILRERFARGEIDAEEYERGLETLRGSDANRRENPGVR